MRIRLPDFLGIGAEKCATTWLFKILHEHPDIYLPQIKEIRFFDNEYHRGVKWYAKFFSNIDKAKFVGEVSPQYFHNSKCAKRIAETLPNIKLVLILRNPIDRAYSQYWMNVRDWKIKSHEVPTFIEAINLDSDYLEKGLYYDQLKIYLNLIEKNRILILLQDDIEKTPLEVCETIYSFIGADEKYMPIGLWSKENVAAEYNHPTIFGILKRFVRFAENVGLEKLIIWFKNNGIRDWVLKKLKKQIKYPNMDQILRRELTEYFSISNKKISAVIGRDLSGWQ